MLVLVRKSPSSRSLSFTYARDAAYAAPTAPKYPTTPSPSNPRPDCPNAADPINIASAPIQTAGPLDTVDVHASTSFVHPAYTTGLCVMSPFAFARAIMSAHASALRKSSTTKTSGEACSCRKPSA